MPRKTKARLDEEIRELLSPSTGRRATRARDAARAGSAPRTGAYLALGADGEPWPPWLTDLQDTSGAYVIRDAATRRPLYAGSAKNNLYSTITRHFQQWRRQKKWWKGQYGAGHDPGLVYDRSRCEVAIWVTAEERRLEKETQLILRLHPRDNLVEHPDGELEEAPF
jgi:hypothetical protein